MSWAISSKSIVLALTLGQFVSLRPSAASDTKQAATQPPWQTLRQEFRGRPCPITIFAYSKAGADRIEKHLGAQPKADLDGTLEARDESWRLLSHAALVGAVLYAEQDPANRSYQRPQMLRSRPALEIYWLTKVSENSLKHA